MKKPPTNRTRKYAQAAPPPVDAPVSANAAAFTPAADDVAHRAYLKHQNQGLRDGHDVADWLTAEAELIAEHHLVEV